MVKFTSENAPKKTTIKAKGKPDRRKPRLERSARTAGAGAPVEPFPSSLNITGGRQHRLNAVILIGFMGAGKSSVGRLVGEKLGWAFQDLDEQIERFEKRTVAEIFRDLGEEGFRRIEHDVLKHLLSQLRAGTGKIVALGGGAFVQKRNVELIKTAQAVTLFLDGDTEELWKRCKQQAKRERIHRPLLRDLNTFRKLYESRKPHYLKASFRQDTTGKSVEKIAREIIEILEFDPIGDNRGEN